jgi:hypothetical protein
VRFGSRSAGNMADRLGVHAYPHTVAGLTAGAVATLMLAMANDLIRRPG